MKIVTGGTEILVSTTNAQTQASQQITTLADGGFVVTWRGVGVYGRVFAADGTPVNDSDFLISPSVPPNFVPEITALADGRFAVTDGILGRVFAADGTLVTGSDFEAGEVSALANGGFAVVLNSYVQGPPNIRVYAADGTPVGSDFRISTTSINVSETQITALADGGFAVTWYTGGAFSGQVFAADGTPVNGSDFSTSGDNHAVTALANGGFVVTSDYAVTSDLADDIHARVFAADGTPVGSDFLVSTTNASSQVMPDIAALADGGFAVTWGSLDNGGCVRGRVFAADGTPVNDSDFLVSAVNTGIQYDYDVHGPAITALADGGFAVTWVSGSNPGSGLDIRGQVFAADGTPVNGSDFLVSTADTSDDPQITALADGGFAVTFQSWDSSTYFDIHARVFSVNEVPEIISNGAGAEASVSVAENTTAVTTVTADVGQPLSYSISGGADESKFTIDPTTGALSFRTAPDFELPADANGDNVYDVIVQVSDGNGGIDTQAIAVTVTDAFENAAPLFTSNGSGDTAAVSVAENATAVTTVTASDPDIGQTLNYSIVGGADASKFTIGSSTGALSFVAAPNFELPSDAGGNNVYDVIVRASDGQGGIDTQAIAVTVTDVFENSAPTITSNGGGNAAAVSLAENTTAVTTVTATDPDNGQTRSYSIIGGADAGKFTIGSTTGSLSFVTAPNFELPTDNGGNNIYDVIVQASDVHGGIDSQAIAVTVQNVEEDVINGGNGNFSFNFKLTDATISFAGNHVIVDGPRGSHTVLTGVDTFVFTDGTVNDDDGDPLVNDLFYYSHNRDVWNAHVDADQHYHQSGWHEGRDPNAFFSTSFYLSLNQDVKQAGVDPLAHFHQSGWREGRQPSAAFDDAAYLAANPDVAAARIDPLAHFLQSGQGEGRQATALTSLIAPRGFDSVFYLQHNPDVQAAQIDPFQHYQNFGWKEGRNPNALFDAKGYLNANPDVANAHINPLDHYDQFGWREGRDPSTAFDTTEYLRNYSDVAAAHVDPLVHYLQHGIHEGRQTFADGLWV